MNRPPEHPDAIASRQREADLAAYEQQMANYHAAERQRLEREAAAHREKVQLAQYHEERRALYSRLGKLEIGDPELITAVDTLRAELNRHHAPGPRGWLRDITAPARLDWQKNPTQLLRLRRLYQQRGEWHAREIDSRGLHGYLNPPTSTEAPNHV